jgi:hypothetical protein
VGNTIRCKFTCNEITKRVHREYQKPDSFLYEAKFGIVYDGSDENKQFFKWTPSGSLSVGVYTQDAFQPGKEYYIDITPAEVTPPSIL